MTARPRLLVTGATGLLGHAAVSDLRDTYDVVAVTHTRDLALPGVESVRAELADLDAVAALVAGTQVVVNTAALVRPDDCEREPDQAELLNRDLPARLAAECARAGSRLVHISTDAVYGPQPAPLSETLEPRPDNVYAGTKLAGERAVLDASPDALVLRVNFFGWSSAGNRSLAEFFLNRLRAGDQAPGFTDVEFSTVYHRDLVDLVRGALDAGVSGVRNAGGSEAMSKFRFGQLVAETFGFDPALVVPSSRNDAGLTAARSASLVMDSSRLAADLGRPLPTATAGLRRMHDDERSGWSDMLAEQIHGPTLQE